MFVYLIFSTSISIVGSVVVFKGYDKVKLNIKRKKNKYDTTN